MIIPTLDCEKTLFSKGSATVVGLDEAGRGAWAGPIVAGAVIITSLGLPLYGGRKLASSIYTGKEKFKIRDSKLLSASQRMRAYEFLTKNFECAFGIVESVEHYPVSIK